MSPMNSGVIGAMLLLEGVHWANSGRYGGPLEVMDILRSIVLWVVLLSRECPDYGYDGVGLRADENVLYLADVNVGNRMQDEGRCRNSVIALCCVHARPEVKVARAARAGGRRSTQKSRRR